MDGVHGGRLSRRELIAGTLGAGGVAVFAAVDPAAAAAPPDDGTLLTAALKAEQLSVMAYEHVAALPELDPAQRSLLLDILAHERAHLQALSVQLTALGRALPPPPTDPAQVDQALSDHGMSGHLAGVKTDKDALKVLLRVGWLCEGAYYAAIRGFSASGPVVLTVQALASEAQHTALVAQMLYENDVGQAVPSWYVAGVR